MTTPPTLLPSYPHTLLSPHGRLLDLRRPAVMGILNLTPDSFWAGSRTQAGGDLLGRADTMLRAGAAILDLGAYSSRPGAEDISEDEEKHRLLPALAAVRREFPDAFLSVDTFRAGVAAAAVAAGADLVNDIGGGTLDAQMFATVARLGVPYGLMHLRGTPQTMSRLTTYADDLILTVLRFFRDQLAGLRAAGGGAVPVLLDPGLGFAKTPAQSHALLRRLPELRALERPLLIGLSRKKLIYGPLGLTPAQALPGTIALNALALRGGARVLRVHDVAEARQTIALFLDIFPETVNR